MMYCPACGSVDQFTQEGLNAILIRLGYYICLDCLRIVKPVQGAKAASVEPGDVSQEK